MNRNHVTIGPGPSHRISGRIIYQTAAQQKFAIEPPLDVSAITMIPMDDECNVRCTNIQTLYLTSCGVSEMLRVEV